MPGYMCVPSRLCGLFTWVTLLTCESRQHQTFLEFSKLCIYSNFCILSWSNLSLLLSKLIKIHVNRVVLSLRKLVNACCFVYWNAGLKKQQCSNQNGIITFYLQQNCSSIRWFRGKVESSVRSHRQPHKDTNTSIYLL